MDVRGELCALSSFPLPFFCFFLFPLPALPLLFIPFLFFPPRSLSPLVSPSRRLSLSPSLTLPLSLHPLLFLFLLFHVLSSVLTCVLVQMSPEEVYDDTRMRGGEDVVEGKIGTAPNVMADLFPCTLM